MQSRNGHIAAKVVRTSGLLAILAAGVLSFIPSRTSAQGPPSEILAMPNAVSSFGATTCNGWLYIYGGHSGKTHQYSTATAQGSFYRLNMDAPTAWETLPEGPKLQGLALVTHDGLIYRIGGMQPQNGPDEPSNTISIASCARFDPSKGQWETLPDLPEPRSSHDATVVGDNIVVAGGWNMRGKEGKPAWHKTALVLDMTKDPLRWDSIDQPFQRRALAIAAVDQNVYVLGGLTVEGEIELTVDVLDLSSGQWSTGPVLPEPEGNGFSPAAWEIDQSLVVCLGDGTVQRLNADGSRWTQIAEISAPRVVHRMVAHGTVEAWIIGGAGESGNVSSIEAVRLPTAKISR